MFPVGSIPSQQSGPGEGPQSESGERHHGAAGWRKDWRVVWIPWTISKQSERRGGDWRRGGTDSVLQEQ